ncbi:uncharacterized protein MELLADRAFT_91695 [Melampsora larici-populina 98AG31]|uniref:Uncharacterized protein n=1 Tax=Melampsora larici-populina (strain 98AG31 / pathotype 3-4-7) TaxID=747676 RepID=F4RZZ7_MELLP|nr:uncharacterized protein MELLADRAFT_91695 [Melampsora larici-populina 98AG31]EGG02101.1 hypothetical protein MELLADRAFT_91695 [Melampsora larici-populina 98AG31]
MLAGIAKVKLETLDRELGEGAVPWGQDDFRRFMAYGKDSLKLRTKQKGWKALDRGLYSSTKERLQFQVFFALAGIPNTQEADEKEPPAEGSAPKVPSLTPEEEAQYRPLYDKLVAHEKVIEQQGRPTSDKDINKRSLKRVRQLGKILARDGDRLNFKYVFLASSAHPPSANSGAGWSRQFTSVPAITKWADREIGLLPVFATVAQGESMINTITRNHNQNDKKSKGPSTHAPQPSDVLKTTLANTLKERMIATLGYCPTRGKGFPLTADPVAGLVKRKVPVRIVQEPGSKLSAEDLKFGHKAMPKVNRQEWLDDLISNHFRLELVEGVEKSASKSGENQQVVWSKGKGKRTSKIKSKDIVSDNEEEEEVDEDEEEEGEEDDCIDDDDDDDNDDDDDDGNGDELDDDDDN